MEQAYSSMQEAYERPVTLGISLVELGHIALSSSIGTIMGSRDVKAFVIYDNKRAALDSLNAQSCAEFEIRVIQTLRKAQGTL